VVKVLQAVELAERCFLSELLDWLAFRRLPLALFTINGEEARFSDESGYEAGGLLDRMVTDTECAAAGLPPNPEYVAVLAGQHFHDLDFYDKMLALRLEEGELETLRKQRVEAVEYHRRMAQWQVSLDNYLEYFKARLFVDLREGKIHGSGIEIPAKDEVGAIAYIQTDGFYLSEQPTVRIPEALWTHTKIDWENSALIGDQCVYCWVHFSTEAMISSYPIPSPLITDKVNSVGDLYVLDGAGRGESMLPSRRGRPPLPWDQFHLEVAALTAAGALPRKKEAAIHHFVEWFREEFGVSASRSSIGQKLTPYYERFMRS
jgi:hypothetical protein